MSRRSACRRAAVLALALGLVGGALAHAGDGPPLASIGAPTTSPRAADKDIVIRRSASPQASGTSRGGPWWLGSAGVVAIFAGLGYAVWSARRQGMVGFRLNSRPKGLEVVGRTALTPKHHVHLLRAGERILLIGTGPGGSPAFLGEWSGPDPSVPATPASRPPRAEGGGA